MDYDIVDNKGEIMCIKLVGGIIISDGYVNGQVIVVCVIGDWYLLGFKGVNEMGFVIVEFEIWIWEFFEDDEFLFMGCDGLWNVFINDQVILFVCWQLWKYNDLE